MNSKINYDRLLKFYVAGAPCSGKTCLISRYCQDLFDKNNIYSLGGNFVNDI